MTDLISRTATLAALEALKQPGAKPAASFGNGALERAIWAVEKLPAVRRKRRKTGFKEFD